jgi:hypothetical protein
MKMRGVFGDETEICKLRTVIDRGPPSGAIWIICINDKYNAKIVRLHLHNEHYSLIKYNYQLHDWILINYDESQCPRVIRDSKAVYYLVNVIKKFGTTCMWP